MKVSFVSLFAAAALGFSGSPVMAGDFKPASENLILYDQEAFPVGQVKWDDVKAGMPDKIVMNEYGVFEVTLTDASTGWLDGSMFSDVQGVTCSEQEIASAEITGKGAVTAGGMGAGASGC
ncbi:MAG: hypothetical protein AAGH38_02650 [Pseudomonadota bacterium]